MYGNSEQSRNIACAIHSVVVSNKGPGKVMLSLQAPRETAGAPWTVLFLKIRFSFGRRKDYVLF